MNGDVRLPGLERLLDVCGKTGYPVELSPPGRTPPQAGGLIAGHPFDPLLATVYRRLGAGRFGGMLGQLHLYRVDDQVNAIAVNAETQDTAEEPFQSALCFGTVPGLAYYFATVPKLADARGYQPVIYMDTYEEGFVVPVASDVDRFFDTFSHYIELVVHDVGYRAGAALEEFFFPLTVPRLIARDRPLVERLSAGDFDFLMTRTEGTRKWVSQVKKAARHGGGAG